MTRARTAVALSAALLLALTGCADGGGEPAAESAPATSPPPRANLLVRGTFTLTLPDFGWSEKTLQCAGRGGYSDLQAGTQVIVTDPAGVNLGIGRLETGQPQVDPEDPHRATECLFTFQVPDVPSGKGIYGVEVANRGKVQFKESDLGDVIALTLN
ncbi:hypothetical protein [Micromonospora sp. C41]|uniref:hypothetical protein n=1 Tax=Micromonospora sp. C41 TaxID=2824878 RepID=UPI001B37850A|nr:hypothetical protein [Micromonospora sp. C41]MBQ1060060.1 hypothetical protein [Micromonospora sp. C41]